MGWTERVNAAVAYIEANLAGDIAQIAGWRTDMRIVDAHGEKLDMMRYYRAATWVILEAGGEAKDSVQRVHREFYTKWLPSSGYALADAPVIESYLMDTQRVWIAVKKEG